jgi:hypothetical protein
VVETVAVAFRNAAGQSDPDCPRQQTDVDCSGETDVLDVVKVVGVAFRNDLPASTFCSPCSP